MRVIRTILIFLIVFGCFISQASANDSNGKHDWPQWRGKNYDATATETGVFKFDQGFGLKLAWKQPLGSGYSSVSVAGDFAVTMFSDSTYDYVAAFNTKTGKEVWRHKIDSTYVGHDGSHDGPISTPVIADNQVFALAARGELFALDLATGKEIWSSHLVKDYNAKKPWYGFTTSPIVDQDVLIIEIGGQDSTISGFNKNTGEMLWAVGNDTVSYQSPLITNIGAQEQLLCIGDKYLYGMEPGTGKEIWGYRHAGGFISSNPVMAGPNRIFLNYKWGESVMLEVKKADEGYAVEELWTTKRIKDTYSISVYHDGYLYGYNNRILYCLDAETGDVAWRSRQPGDGFLIMVDGHVVVITKKGNLHIVKATPEKYEEVANMDLFDEFSWTPPSFANGSIYARSLSEIARIDIEKVAQLTDVGSDGLAPNSKFAKWVKKVEASDNKQAMVDEFMRSQKSFPVIEGKNLVHFIYRGEATDMGFKGDMIGERRQEPMHRVAGTDLFYYSTELVSDARLSYNFIKNYEENLSDPANPDTTRGNMPPFPTRSIVAMPDWKAPVHLKDPASGLTRGRLDTMRFESEVTESTRKLDVYLPAGYADSDARYPVAYIHGGAEALGEGMFVTSLDNLMHKRVSPVIVVFIHTTNPRELGGPAGKYSKMLAEELVPFIDEKYRTVASPEARANIGTSSGGYVAFFSTFSHPGVFGKIASQSTFLLDFAANQLFPLIKTAEEQPLEIYLAWSKYDMHCVFEGWDFGRSNRQMGKMLQGKGYTLTGGESNEAHGWSFWRSRTGEMFEALFPAQTTQK